MSAQVFISHSSKDASAADTIRQALESRGLACWIAGRDVNPGDNFMSAIVQAIRSAKVMVLVFTEHANTSQEIAKELALASQYQLVVMPVRFEDVVPNDALAYALATSQWTDLFRDWERAIERLSARIAALVALDSPSGENPRVAQPSHQPKDPTSRDFRAQDIKTAPQASSFVEQPSNKASFAPHGSTQNGVSKSTGGEAAPLSTAMRVVGIALIVQGLVRLLFSIIGLTPGLTSGLMVLGCAAIVAGAAILARWTSARVLGLVVCSICLLYQLYSFAAGLSVLSQATTFPATFWIFQPAYLVVFAVSLFLLYRWRPGDR